MYAKCLAVISKSFYGKKKPQTKPHLNSREPFSINGGCTGAQGGQLCCCIHTCKVKVYYANKTNNKEKIQKQTVLLVFE